MKKKKKLIKLDQSKRKKLIKEFVKYNILLLTSKKFDNDEFKKKKTFFFVHKNKNQLGKVVNSELIPDILKYLKNVGKISSIDDLKDLKNEIPFLKKNLHNFEMFKEIFENDNNSVNESLLSIEDLKKINSQEFLEKKEKELKEKIMKKNEEEFEVLKREKQAELDKIPSIIDNIKIKEPKEIENENDIYKEWWETLGLISDPFPNQEGLFDIPSNLIEKITFKNEIIKNFSYKINDNRNKILKKTHLILGGFGTGKTTIFDYLGFQLIRNDIIPIKIKFTQKADVFSFNSEFETKLFLNLKKEYKKKFGQNLELKESSLENSKILINEFNKNNYYIMIIIDDLHRHKKYIEIVFEFLGSLQIMKNELLEEGLKIGFMIAGLPNWEKKIKEDGSLGGFIDTPPEKIKEISPEEAWQVINKRLNSYSINPKRENVIDLVWLKQLYRNMKKEGNFLQYRLYIDEVIKQLKNKNFDILVSNFVEIKKETLKKIEIEIKDSTFWEPMKKLIESKKIKHEHNKKRCLTLIIKIYSNSGIMETQSDFINSKFHFKKLFESGILTKKKVGLAFKWVLEERIEALFEHIKEKFKVYPEDYLNLIFFPNSSKKIEKKTEEKDLEKSLVELMEKNKKHLNEKSIYLITNSIKYLKHFSEELEQTNMDSEKFDKSLSFITSSLSSLSKAYFIEDKLNVIPLKDKETIEFWNLYWYSPDIISNFINEIWYSEFQKNKTNLGSIFKSFCLAYKEITNSLNLLLEVRLKTSIEININKLTPKENRKLNRLRYDFSISNSDKDYFNIAEGLNSLIENKFRKSFFNHFKLMFGDLKKRLSLMEKEKDVILKNGNIGWNDPSFNEFENLNRNSYCKIIKNNKYLKTQYFELLFDKWSENDISTFLDIFYDYDKKTSHKKKQSITISDQSSILRFFISILEILEKINNIYIKFLIENNYFIINNKKSEITCYFSLMGRIKNKQEKKILRKEEIKDSKKIKGITFSLDEMNSLYYKLELFTEELDYYILDIEDFEMIENLFTIDYRKFCAIISAINHLSEKSPNGKYRLRIESFFGSQIKIYMN